MEVNHRQRRHIKITKAQIEIILKDFNPTFKCRYNLIIHLLNSILGIVLTGRDPPEADEGYDSKYN